MANARGKKARKEAGLSRGALKRAAGAPKEPSKYAKKLAARIGKPLPKKEDDNV